MLHDKIFNNFILKINCQKQFNNERQGQLNVDSIVVKNTFRIIMNSIYVNTIIA